MLVLDEPTEGLDSATADAVLADLLDATEGRSTLLVTHRPACLAAADEILVLDDRPRQPVPTGAGGVVDARRRVAGRTGDGDQQHRGVGR